MSKEIKDKNEKKNKDEIKRFGKAVFKIGVVLIGVFLGGKFGNGNK